MSALGQKQTFAPQNVMSALPPIATVKADIRKRSCPLCPRKQTCAAQTPMSALGQKRTHAPQQTSGRAFSVVSFVYLSAERLFNKFYGINCRPEFDSKLLDCFIHLWRQVSPPIDNLTHRFLNGSQHFFYCNFTVGLRHGAVTSSPSR